MRISRLILLFLLAAPALADVRLPGLFSDFMVLQRGEKITIWGWADPGEKVTVTFEDRDAETVAGDDHRWQVQIGPYSARTARVLKVRGKNLIEIEHVCVGDVWICGGQSNMQWPVSRSMNAQAEVDGANNYQLRFFTVGGQVAETPREDARGRWTSCRPATVADFSAVAYFFGRDLRAKLDVPIGLIDVSLGGTPAEAWMRRDAVAAHPDTQPIVARWDKVVEEWPERNKEFRAAVDQWKKAAAEAKAAGEPAPKQPRPPTGPKHPHRVSGLFHGMVAPLTRLAVKGVIWYQGESNAARAAQYRTLFPALIRDWRDAWGRSDLPFLFVQLANFRPLVRDPGASAWAELREAQRQALAEPRTAMVVAIDVGDARDIHPRNKQEVGRRLALAARRLVYRESDLVASGPAYRAHAVRDGKVVIEFDHAAGGLTTQKEDPLRGFAIAGADGEFRWAHARLEGETVVVWHPRVPEPVDVRYGWADNPICNLCNRQGLPASPFRTDDQPFSTEGKH